MSITLTQESNRPHVAHLRLDFNELNLLTIAEANAFRERILAIPDEVAVLTITAERDDSTEDVRGLSAGLNLEWARSLGPHEGQELLQALYEMIEAIRRLDAVVICGCGSYTLGAGFELALACEFRVATRDSRLGLPEVNVGLPTVIHGGLLTRFVGLQTASELIYTGKTITGKRARELELVNRAVAPEEYDAELDALVDQLGKKPPNVLKTQKRVMRRFRPVGLERGMSASVGDMGRVFGTDEQREAMDAFFEG